VQTRATSATSSRRDFMGSSWTIRNSGRVRARRLSRAVIGRAALD
jgi:hypothetical protein